MSTISVFIHLSADGMFAGPNDEIDWFHDVPKDDEHDQYSHQQAQTGHALLFGRKTYEMMKSYWPTEQAIKTDPRMAEVMNNSRKIIVSKTLKSVEEGPNWKNLELIREIDRDQISKLKESVDITTLGSGSVVQQLANLGLIDEYQLTVVPIILGSGKPLFKDVRKMKLNLADSKRFKNGLLVLKYRAA
jgi:dihydrofolate reductase